MNLSQREARKSRQEKIRNLKIREIINFQQNITGVIEKRRLTSLGTLQKMGSDRIKKMIQNGISSLVVKLNILYLRTTYQI